MNIPRMLGMLTGIAVGLIIALVIFRFVNRDGKVKTTYDEMQEVYRGRGFRIGFYTLLIYLALLMVLDMGGITLPMEGSVLYFSGIFLGLAVDIIYCMIHGAYFGINNNARKYVIVMMFPTLINLAVGIGAFLSGSMFADGRLQTPFINLLCGILFLIVVIFMAFPKRAEAEE